MMGDGPPYVCIYRLRKPSVCGCARTSISAMNSSKYVIFKSHLKSPYLTCHITYDKTSD